MLTFLLTFLVRRQTGQVGVRPVPSNTIQISLSTLRENVLRERGRELLYTEITTSTPSLSLSLSSLKFGPVSL